MKKISIVLTFTLSGLILEAQPVFVEKGGSLTGTAVNTYVDFNRNNTDLTVPATGTYMVMVSAQGSGAMLPGDPGQCHHSEMMVSVWSRTKNTEIVKTPFDYVFADGGGAKPGLKHLSFPYYNIEIRNLAKDEVLGLRAHVMRHCPANATIGSWNIYAARVKIVRIN